MSNRIIYNQKQKAPSPTAPRECACGCGHIFQPNRSDQRFLDKSHADYYNYHNVKKVKNEVRNDIEKIHRRNNRICAKYYNTMGGYYVIVNLESLLNEGFNLKFTQGQIKHDSQLYALTYNYAYHIFKANNILKIKIFQNA